MIDEHINRIICGDCLETTKNGHPEPFPVALINSVISSTHVQTILGQFMGSGTTASVAVELKHDYIGIELSPEIAKWQKDE